MQHQKKSFGTYAERNRQVTYQNGPVSILVTRWAWRYRYNFNNGNLVIYFKKFILVVGALKRPTLLTV